MKKVYVLTQMKMHYALGTGTLTINETIGVYDKLSDAKAKLKEICDYYKQNFYDNKIFNVSKLSNKAEILFGGQFKHTLIWLKIEKKEVE